MIVSAREDFGLSIYELVRKAEAGRAVYGKEAATNILSYLTQALEIDPGKARVKGLLALVTSPA